MSGYLDRIGAGKVLLIGAFFFDWTPDELVGRDEELTGWLVYSHILKTKIF